LSKTTRKALKMCCKRFARYRRRQRLNPTQGHDSKCHDCPTIRLSALILTNSLPDFPIRSFLVMSHYTRTPREDLTSLVVYLLSYLFSRNVMDILTVPFLKTRSGAPVLAWPAVRGSLTNVQPCSIQPSHNSNYIF
jgi:hypothetical protein